MSSSDGAATDRTRGRLIVVSGPSGAGKTSICKALLDRLPDAMWSVSITTRRQRAGEIAGEWYEFVSPREFESREAAGELLESADYVGERYGTPREPVERALAAGRDVVMEIDVQGGVQVAEKVPESIRLFILPPDMKSLRARLEGRQTEAREQLAKRLASADGEIAAARDSGCYQYFVINDCLDATIEEVFSIIQKEKATA